MARIISQKIWIKFSEAELLTIIRERYPELRTTKIQLVDLQHSYDDHQVHEVTLGVKHELMAESS